MLDASNIEMENIPLVSIIIVNYNGRNYLEKCLKSLKQTSYSNFEIILVDNNSNDTSIEFVQSNYPEIEIITLDKNYGFAEPNNIGARKAKGDFLVFLNNDTEVTPNWISELVNTVNSDSKIAICQSLLLSPNGNIDSSGDFVDIYGRAYSSRNKVNKVTPILSARGACMLIKKDIFYELGGFDENFFASFEDVDLGWRACMWGYKVVLVPNSIVKHNAGTTIKNLKQEIQFHGAKNTLILRLVNFELSFASKSILVLFLITFAKKFFGINVIKEPEKLLPLPSSKIILKGIFWILKNLSYVCDKRKLVNSRRIRSTKELIEMGLITKL